MLKQLQDKKVIFFDVGYTLEMPASGDWMFTNLFYKEAGDRIKKQSNTKIQTAAEAGLQFLSKNHLVTTVEAEVRQFFAYYSMISDALDLDLSEEQRENIARDRALNMDNYILYPGVYEVLEKLSKTHKLGIISDTWPSMERRLEHSGISHFFSFMTCSCYLGVFKPNSRMYLDALQKSGVPATMTVFIDDSPRNLEGAAALGIMPILIAANPASDVETQYLKIHSLNDLIQEHLEEDIKCTLDNGHLNFRES